MDSNYTLRDVDYDPFALSPASGSRAAQPAPEPQSAPEPAPASGGYKLRDVDYDPFAAAPASGSTAAQPAPEPAPASGGHKLRDVDYDPFAAAPAAAGGSTEPAIPEPAASPKGDRPSAISNIVRGVGERGIELVGGTAGTIGRIAESAGDWLDQKLGKPVWDANGNLTWRRLTPEETKGTSSWITQKLLEVQEGMKNPDLGYDPRTTWQDVKNAPFTNVVPFAVEQGLVSLPDMVAAVRNAPGYVIEQTGEISTERAKNEGRAEPTFGDMIKALPAATISAMMEKIGTSKVLGLGEAALTELKQIPAELLKTLLTEGATEAAQQASQYTGERAFTQKGMDWWELAEQTVQAAVVGALFGPAVRGPLAAVEVATGPKKGAQPAPQPGVLPEPEGGIAGGQPTPGGTSATTPPPPAGTPPAATEPAPSSQPREPVASPPAAPLTTNVTTLGAGGVDPDIAATMPAEKPAQQPRQGQPAPFVPPGTDVLVAPSTAAPAAPATPARPVDVDIAAALAPAPQVTRPSTMPEAPMPPVGTQEQAPVRAQAEAIPSESVSSPLLPREPQPGRALRAASPEITPATPATPVAQAPISSRPAPSPPGPAAPLVAATVATERAGPAPSPAPAVSLEPAAAPRPSEEPTRFGAGEEISGFAPQPVVDAVGQGGRTAPGVSQSAPGAVTPTPQPAPALSGNQQRAMADIAQEIDDIYRYADPAVRSQLTESDRAEAEHFIARQPPKHPRAKMLASARAHLRTFRAERDAREQAERIRPAERERQRGEMATTAAQRAAEAPQREANRAERARRAAAHSVGFPEEPAATERERIEGGPSERTAAAAVPDEDTVSKEPTSARSKAADKAITDLVDKLIEESSATAADGHETIEPALDKALKEESKKGQTPTARADRSRPGSAQDRAERRINRVIADGASEALEKAAADGGTAPPGDQTGPVGGVAMPDGDPTIKRRASLPEVTMSDSVLERHFADLFPDWASPSVKPRTVTAVDAERTADAAAANAQLKRDAEEIDKAVRVEANPLLQWFRSRSSQVALRSRLRTRANKPLRRLTVLGKREPAKRQLFDDLMQEASRLGVDPSKPLRSAENEHLKNSFTENYQGFKAHAELSKRYDQLVADRTDIAQLWSDVQKVMADLGKNHLHENVATLVSQALRNTNLLRVKQGKPGVPMRRADVDAMTRRIVAGEATTKAGNRADKKAGKATVAETDEEVLGPKSWQAISDLVEAPFLKGTYAPFARSGDFVVRWTAKIELPANARWAKNDDGSNSDSRFIANEGGTEAFHKQTLDENHPNFGLTILAVKPVKFDADGNPVEKIEGADNSRYEAIPGKPSFEIEVQRRGLSMHDTAKDAGKAADAIRKELGEEGDVKLDRRDKMLSSDLLPADVDDLINGARSALSSEVVDEATADMFEEQLRATALARAAGRSAGRHRLHRKRVKGYDTDLVRAVDSYVDMTSAAIAKLRHSPDTAAALRGMEERIEQDRRRVNDKTHLMQQRVLEIARKRTADPVDLYQVDGRLEKVAHALLTFSFLKHMADVSSALMNATQTFFYTIPHLSGDFGEAAAMGAMGKATLALNPLAGVVKTFGKHGVGRDVLRAGRWRRGAPERLDFMERNRGLLGKQADGKWLQRMYDDLERIGTLTGDVLDIKSLEASRQGKPTAFLEFFANLIRPIHTAVERFNQDSTAVAAYRLAREKALANGKSEEDAHQEAVEYADRAVRYTQFPATYATSAPLLKKRGLVRFPLQFSRFSLDVLNHAVETTRQALPYANGTKEQKSVARRQLATWNLLYTATLGVSSHPLAALAGAVIQSLAFGLGYEPQEWDVKMEEWLKDQLGDVFGAILSRGVLGQPQMPFDVVKRLGLSEPFVQGHPHSFDAKGVREWLFDEMIGAPGESVMEGLKIPGLVKDGDYKKIFEALAPKLVTNVLKASEGGPVSKGKPVGDPYTWWEMALKGIGLQPMSEAEFRREDWSGKVAQRAADARKSALRDQFYEAPTQAQKRIVLARIRAYNRGVREENRISDESLKQGQTRRVNENEKLPRGQRKRIVTYDF